MITLCEDVDLSFALRTQQILQMTIESLSSLKLLEESVTHVFAVDKTPKSELMNTHTAGADEQTVDEPQQEQTEEEQQQSSSPPPPQQCVPCEF